VNRRAFITLLGGAAVAWPLAARAQQAAMPVIGYFSARSPDTEAPLREPFLRALEKLGFAAGRNIAIEYRFAEGQEARLPALAAELVGRRVAMLVATDRPQERRPGQFQSCSPADSTLSSLAWSPASTGRAATPPV
jgi:putative ABC transport system substrate-binding protein